MTDEEKKAQREELLKSIEDQVKKVMADSTKENVSKKDLDDRLAEINKQIAEGLGNEEIKTLKESVDKMAKAQEELVKAVETQGTALNKLQETGPGKDQPKSFGEMFKAAIREKKDFLHKKSDTNGERESLKEYFEKTGNQWSPSFVMKDAVDMLQSNIVQSDVQGLRLTQLDPQRVGIPLTIYPHVMDVLPSRGISRPRMALLVVYDYEDGVGTKTEGSASTKSSFLLKTVEFPAFFVATHFVLSEETMDDLNEVADEINTIGPDKINDNIDTKILGQGGDDVTDIAGFLSATVATAKKTDFVATTWAGQVNDANIVDVIEKAKLQAKKNKYRPNVVYMSPDDVSNLGSAKNAFEDSRFDRRVVFDMEGNPVRVVGLRIIESEAVAQNTCIVFDNRQTQIGVRKDMTIEIGRNGTDMVEGQYTIVIKIRLAFGVRDAKAIIYVSDIEAAAGTLGGGA